MQSITSIVEDLDDRLRAEGDDERAVQEKRYLKSPIRHYGASVPAIRRVVRSILAEYRLSRRPLLGLVRRLWSSDVHEHRMAAVTILEERSEMLLAEDLALLETMIRSSFTWAYVDSLAASVAGVLIERHPRLADELDRWATDESFWLRRAALLALLLPLRRGEGDWERFTRYADGMLAEEEFFIRKAIGWVLRDASKQRPARVRSYLRARLVRLSPLTFREAVRRLPESDRTGLTVAYEAARRR